MTNSAARVAQGTRVVSAFRLSQDDWEYLGKMMVQWGEPQRGKVLARYLTTEALDSITAEDIHEDNQINAKKEKMMTNLRLSDNSYSALERAVERCAPTNQSEVIRCCLHKDFNGSP